MHGSSVRIPLILRASGTIFKSESGLLQRGYKLHLRHLPMQIQHKAGIGHTVSRPCALDIIKTDGDEDTPAYAQIIQMNMQKNKINKNQITTHYKKLNCSKSLPVGHICIFKVRKARVPLVHLCNAMRKKPDKDLKTQMKLATLTFNLPVFQFTAVFIYFSGTVHFFNYS